MDFGLWLHFRVLRVVLLHHQIVSVLLVFLALLQQDVYTFDSFALGLGGDDGVRGFYGVSLRHVRLLLQTLLLHHEVLTIHVQLVILFEKTRWVRLFQAKVFGFRF